MTQERNYMSDVVLGMHDALVSLTGLIAGLAFTLADRYVIIMSAIIASVAASLSMAASNYLACRAGAGTRRGAILSGLYTGGAYVATCALLITPFIATDDVRSAMWIMIAVAVCVIFLFNLCVARIKHTSFMGRFLEMLIICVGVSVAAYLIGDMAKMLL